MQVTTIIIFLNRDLFLGAELDFETEISVHLVRLLYGFVMGSQESFQVAKWLENCFESCSIPANNIFFDIFEDDISTIFWDTKFCLKKFGNLKKRFRNVMF